MTIKKSENVDYCSYIQSFIATVSLLNDFMKIFVHLGIFNRAISKDLGSDCYCKNSLS